LGARNFQSATAPVLRRTWNKFVSSVISGIIGNKIKDSQSGFRSISKNLISKIISSLEFDDYRIESEMVFCAAKQRADIVEIPVQTIFNKRFSLVDFFKNILRLLKISSFVLRTKISRFHSKISLLQITYAIVGAIFFGYLILGDYLNLRAALNKDYQYSNEMIDVLNWLKNASRPDDIVLSEWTQGHQIVTLANRRVVTSSKVYPSEAQEVSNRYKDLARFFFASSEDEAKKILEKYNVSWIFVKKKFDNFICRYINACSNLKPLISRILNDENLGIIYKAYESPNFLIYRVGDGEKFGLVNLYSGVFDSDLIRKGFGAASKRVSNDKKVIGIIIPHHYPYINYLLADVFSQIASSSFETVIIIGPDHKNIASSSLTTSLAVWDTPFGSLKPKKEIIEFLAKEGLKIDNSAHLREWSLRTSFPYIKYVFPDVTLVPILLQKAASVSEIDKLAELLDSKLPPQTLFVLSTDFVHRLPVEEAEKEDIKSMNAIKSFNKAEIGNLNMDAQAGLKLFLDIMEKRGAKAAELVWHSNVFEEQRQHSEFKPFPYLVTYMTWVFTK